MAGPRLRPPRTRPLRWRHLAALGGVLLAVLAVLAGNELRAARQLAIDAMEEGSVSLVQSLSRASENAIRADALVESATAQRLLGQAHLLAELDRQVTLDDTRLARLARQSGLYRIEVLDTAGRCQHATPRVDLDPEATVVPTALLGVLRGRQDELVFGFRQGEVWGDGRYAAAVGRTGGGAIVVSMAAAEMLSFRRAAGIGRLVQEIGSTPGLAYVVVQDRQGLVLASRGVARLGRIEGDPFLEASLAAETPSTRLTTYQDRSVLEATMPFWVNPDNKGLIRVGVGAEAVSAAESRARRRLAVWAALLGTAGLAALGWIVLRHNYGLLAEEHQRVQTYSGRLLAHMADAVVAIDRDGGVDWLNPAAERLFAVREADVHGQPVAVALGEVGERLDKAWREGEEVRDTSCQCHTRDGRAVVLAASLSLIRDREGQTDLGVAVFQDLTERRALEAGLRRRERLSAMGELASGVAHEVRNPLNAIAVIAQRLQREFVPTDDQEEYRQLTGTVRNEVSRVNQIVRQFLDLARPPALVPQPTDLAELLAESLRLATSSATGQRVRVEGHVEQAGSATVDPAQLRQAVLNLLVNAIEAVASHDTPRAGWVRLTAWRGGNEVSIAVADNGPGIAPACRERIFDLYYTTKATGTGLGLAMVQRIVSEHGGRVELDTELGRGTTFTLHLPLDPGKADEGEHG